MRTVFADAFYWFALLSERDRAHNKAVAFNNGFDAKLVTTDWVITELADGWSKIPTRSCFWTTLEFIDSEPGIEVVEPSQELWRAGIDLFRDRPDKEWSLTDCISFVVMERQGLTEALTGDHHFEQAGYIALLK